MMRLSFCYPTPDRITEGVRRLATVLDNELELQRTFGSLRPRTVFGPQSPSPGHWLKTDRTLLKIGEPRVTDRTVAVLAGGLSHERDVSLRSGRRLSSSLRDTGLYVEEWDVDAKLISRLNSGRPDAVVIALHGGAGENGAVQSVLEMLGVPYVGADPQACRRAWDKPTAKDELARAGLSTPEWITLPHATFRDLGAQDVLDALVARLGLPLILKPPQGGSALGAAPGARGRRAPGRHRGLPGLRGLGARRELRRRR